MKFKLLRDVKVAGVTHKAGEVHSIDKMDKYNDDNGTLELCFGHGEYWQLKRGVDFEVIQPQSNTTKRTDITVAELCKNKEELEIEATKLLRDLVQKFIDDTGVPVYGVSVHMKKMDMRSLDQPTMMLYTSVSNVEVELGI